MPQAVTLGLDQRLTSQARYVPRLGHDAHLPQQTHRVELAPVLDDLAVGQTHDVHPHRLHPSAGWSYPHEFSFVGAAQDPTERHLFPFPEAVGLGHAQVGEGGSNRGEPSTDELQLGYLRGERMIADPRLVDSTVDYSVELYAAHRHLVAGGRQPQELAEMSPSCCPSGSDLVVFGELVLDGEPDVGEGGAVGGDVPPYAPGTVHLLRKTGIVQNVSVGEDLVRPIEVSGREDLSEPPADESFVLF
jgi:hypothetical protein